MELVQVGGRWEWRPRTADPSEAKAHLPTVAPIAATPVTVVDSPSITITEFFGNVSSKSGDMSFAQATVHRADEASFQTPLFAEYVLVTAGSLDLLTVSKDGAGVTTTHVPAGKGVYLPSGMRVKWTWPEPCTYSVVCVPAFSPLTSGSDTVGDDMVIDSTSRAQLAKLHDGGSAPTAVCDALPDGVTPLVIEPVAVVDAPGITIYEHFGNVASSDASASLGRAVVKGPSQEAWQAPGFDEFVVCNKGSIEFLYGDGSVSRIARGEGVFLPKHLRVKWVWPEATEYIVLCLPAFTPALCGREAEENATNAKDSASMARLQRLHEAKAS